MIVCSRCIDIPTLHLLCVRVIPFPLILHRWFVNSITSDMELKMLKRILKRPVPKDEDLIFEELEFFCSSTATTPGMLPF